MKSIAINMIKKNPQHQSKSKVENGVALKQSIAFSTMKK